MNNEEIWKKFANIEVSNLGRMKTRNHPLGDYCGCNMNGYMAVRVKGKTIYVHRIVCHLFLGLDLEDAKQMIDHINGDRSDNRLENLRIVSNRENLQNRHEHRNGRLVGCTFYKDSGKWKAQIMIDGKRKFLGLFDTEQSAHEAYMEELSSL